MRERNPKKGKEVAVRRRERGVIKGTVSEMKAILMQRHIKECFLH